MRHTSKVSARAPAEARKIFTVLFCDLVGSTALAERLDSESLREVMDRYFTEMKRVVERHGGIVEKLRERRPPALGWLAELFRLEHPPDLDLPLGLGLTTGLKREPFGPFDRLVH